MQYFVSEIKSLELAAVLSFSERAQSIYDENLDAYVKLVLRKAFAKIIVSLYLSFSWSIY